MKCCVSTDVGTWTNWLTFEPDPDYSPDAGTGLPSPILYALQSGILSRLENPTYAYYCRGQLLQWGVALKWSCSPRAMGTPLSEVHPLYRVPSGSTFICGCPRYRHKNSILDFPYCTVCLGWMIVTSFQQCMWHIQTVHIFLNMCLIIIYLV